MPQPLASDALNEFKGGPDFIHDDRLGLPIYCAVAVGPEEQCPVSMKKIGRIFEFTSPRRKSAMR